MLRTGIILYKTLQPEIKSVQRVHKQFINVLKKNFPVFFYHYNEKTEQKDDFQKFLQSSDAVICVDASRNCRDSAPRIPFIFIALGSFPVGATGFLLSLKFMSNIDVILYSCRSDERILRRIFPRKEIGSYFLPFGIDTEVFQPRPADQRRAVKASLGIPDNSPLLVYAGRLNPHKNVADVINIYAAVVRERPDTLLCIAGGEDHFGTSSGYLQLLKKIVTGYGLAEKVRFAGDLNDSELAALYSGAFAFVTCTTNPDENFGYAPVEAMSCGTPVIGTAWGGLKDTVVHGRTGCLMQTLLIGNTVAFDLKHGVEFILSLLSNPGTRDQMGHASMRHAAEQYSLAVFEKNLCAAVYATIERRNHIKTVISGSKFKLDALACEYLALTEYTCMKRMSFTSENNFWEHNRYRSFFLAPYASQNMLSHG
jgi:glycosyltransferase involved in cell wall biosynthesis